MRVERLIYSILILVGATFAIVNWRRATILAADNEQLRLKIETLETEDSFETNIVDMARVQAQKLRTQMSELMLLRNEVTQLRNESNKVLRLTAENERLKSELSVAKTTTPSAAPESGNREPSHFPRERWTFSGYSSPEAALVSAIWSMKEGNPQSYLDSLAPSEQERMAKVWETKTQGEIAEKHKNDVASISGIRVLERQNISSGEVVMNVLLEGPGRVEKIRMNQVGQDWKFGGFIREPNAP